MKFWFGSKGWGWKLYGVSYKDQWFVGFSRKYTEPTEYAGLCNEWEDWMTGDTK